MVAQVVHSIRHMAKKVSGAEIQVKPSLQAMCLHPVERAGLFCIDRGTVWASKGLLWRLFQVALIHCL